MLYRESTQSSLCASLPCGVSAAVAGVILVVSLGLFPGSLIGIPSIIIAILAFVVITFFKVDVAKVAISAIVIYVGYAALHAVQ